MLILGFSICSIDKIKFQRIIEILQKITIIKPRKIAHTSFMKIFNSRKILIKINIYILRHYKYFHRIRGEAYMSRNSKLISK